jgi:hypothetical protein
MDRLDLKKELKSLYNAPTDEVVEVVVPSIDYLMIDGEGDPSSSRKYKEAIEALFSTAYALKFAVKKSGKADYSVMPLEGLWWAGDTGPFTPNDRHGWLWTAMIAQPAMVTKPLVDSIIPQVKLKKNSAALPVLRFESLEEGRSLQTLHRGPYAAEGPAIARLHLHARERGYALFGKHHEIYLNAPDRTSPDKLKTIIRQPVR